MIGRRTPEAQAKKWMERSGNWRLKMMLSAELGIYDHKEIGQAFRTLSKQKKVQKRHLKKRSQEDLHPEVAPQKSIRPLYYEGKKHSTEKGEIGYNEPSHARELAKGNSKFSEEEMRHTGVDIDKYIGYTLANESFSEKDVLWREQLLDTVIMGARERQVARDLANVVEVDTRRGDHPVQGDDIVAPKTAEGAAIEFNEQNFNTNEWNSDKYALGAYITEELTDHALVDIIEQNLRFIGRAVENSLNRVFINEVVDSADSNNDVEGPGNTTAPFGLDLDNLLTAKNNIVNSDFPAPDTIVMHPEFQLGITAGNNDQNLLFANRAGNQEALSDGMFPEGLFGLDNAGLLTDGIYNGSNTWGFAADGEFGAVMYPQEMAYLYIYRDMETKDFEDPIRDLEGANVRGQFDCTIGQSSAFARIKN